MSAPQAKIGINGFGRIGKMTLRAAFEAGIDGIKFVAINDLAPIESAAYLLKRDSIKGGLQADVSIKNSNTLIVNGQDIAYTRERDPTKIAWGKHDIDIVMECTGLFTNKKAAESHLLAGAKKVLISAPASDADLVIVFGVNQGLIQPDHRIISNASCTTNCLAPIAHVLHENFGIKSGYMITTHAYTSDQRLQDAPHNDPNRARAAALNIIPTSTGAAKTVGIVIPELAGRLDGESNRVPTPNVSIVNATLLFERATTPKEINAAIQKAAESGPLHNVLGYVDEDNDPTAPLVSTDFNSLPYSRLSSVFSLSGTKMTGDLGSFRAWYDNEYGFASRMSDTALHMHSVGYDS